VIFYRRVCVTGKENIPENTPLFFAPNHQNALMDALIILCNIKQQPVFIARADIFKNPLIARILILFKILPAYRIRDGKENLGKNEEIFDISVKILENKNILTLFPETTHNDIRQLRILKKGVQRIVFQAEEKNNFNLGVRVIPIGIYFSNYWNFRSDVQVNFGKPIDISEYNEIYRSNPQKAMLALRDKLSDEIIPLIIHISNNQYYQLFDYMREFYNAKMLKKLSLSSKQENKFKADQKIVEILDKAFANDPDSIKKLWVESKTYQKLLQKLNLRNWVINKNQNLSGLCFKSLGLLLVTPLFFYGLINHFLPYYLPQALRKKIKDRQFLSSVNFVTGLVLYPVFYLIQFILLWVFTDTWWIKFAYLITLPVTGIAAFNLHRFFVKLKSQWKFFFIRSGKHGKVLREIKSGMEDSMDAIMNKYC
jgi:1-acyl-sn-glycerol-3-phosphate acyltransferase